MFLTTYLRLASIVALMLLGIGAASAATVPWAQLSFRVAPSAWVRTATTTRTRATFRESSASAQAPESLLYAFKNTPDGSGPEGGLIADEDGSLYGTTAGGGLVSLPGATFGSGTVFKLTPSRTGGYTESILYRFGASTVQDGEGPTTSNPLARDCWGALYGTTRFGGSAGDTVYKRGEGIVYKLTPTRTGYHETILYSFQPSELTGGFPQANPILDRSGTIYGTTPDGGCSTCLGTVYKLTPTKSGYAFNLVHVFQASGGDGYYPVDGLTLDPRTGDLFGTTTGYGNFLQSNPATGAVFKLHPTTSGFVYSIIHIFQGPDGGTPSANLIMDKSGALYGTAANGGASFGSSNCNDFVAGGCGAVFKLTPTRTGYVESLLYSFTGGSDGGNPASSLVADWRGNLYSTALTGGQYGDGTVFELVRKANGYREVTLHAFNANDAGPSSGMLLEGNHLVGETYGTNQGLDQGIIYALNI